MAAKSRAKKSKALTWPNGKKVAVSITVMFETWPEDSAPNYSVQTTHLKKGTVDHAAKAWSTYGGRVGVWRLIRTFERLGVPATFFVNARCTEVYPDAVKQIAKSGFDIALTCAVADAVPVPVIASGGVGTLDHLVAGIRDGHATAVLAASIFHFGELSIGEVKAAMAAARVPVRPTERVSV